MGRKNTMVVGLSINGFTVVSTLQKYVGTNRLVQVACDQCGTLREAWNTAFRLGRVHCSFCTGKLCKQAQELEAKLPIVAVFDDRLEFYYGDELPPAGVKLYQVISSTTAIPYNAPVVLKANEIPPPDEGYLYHLVVPADWVDYYCDLGDLPDRFAQQALAYYDEHVTAPSTYAYSQNSKGSGTIWTVNGIKYAYIYWRDSNTWPKSYPAPAHQTKPTATTQAPEEFFALGSDEFRGKPKPLDPDDPSHSP